ncbi:MAG: 50S ribosomal protein L10 [Candidatus Kuenenbacteria bacterium]
MPKTKQQKEKVLEKLVKDLEEAKSATLTVFTQVKVNEDQKLRHEMHKRNIEYAVIKKTLLRKSFEKMGFNEVDISDMSGNVSIAISKEDEIAPAKILAEFAKDNKSMQIVGGVLENKWIDAAKVNVLAKLPSKQELIVKTIRTINAPLYGFVNVLAGNLRGLVNVLNGIKEAKE